MAIHLQSPVVSTTSLGRNICHSLFKLYLLFAGSTLYFRVFWNIAVEKHQLYLFESSRVRKSLQQRTSIYWSEQTYVDFWYVSRSVKLFKSKKGFDHMTFSANLVLVLGGVSFDMCLFVPFCIPQSNPIHPFLQKIWCVHYLITYIRYGWRFVQFGYGKLPMLLVCSRLVAAHHDNAWF